VQRSIYDSCDEQSPGCDTNLDATGNSAGAEPAALAALYDNETPDLTVSCSPAQNGTFAPAPSVNAVPHFIGYQFTQPVVPKCVAVSQVRAPLAPQGLLRSLHGPHGLAVHVYGAYHGTTARSFATLHASWADTRLCPHSGRRATHRAERVCACRRPAHAILRKTCAWWRGGRRIPRSPTASGRWWVRCSSLARTQASSKNSPASARTPRTATPRRRFPVGPSQISPTRLLRHVLRPR
jgi:hypothetical protein